MDNLIPVVAIDGLDEAILGTCVLVGYIEVIAYDFYKIVELFGEYGYSEERTREWANAIQELPLEDRKPIFIYTDTELKKEIHGQRSTTH